jgi:hypothetical protein
MKAGKEKWDCWAERATVLIRLLKKGLLFEQQLE